MFRTLALGALLIAVPVALSADSPVDVVDSLRQAIAAYERGDDTEALRKRLQGLKSQGA